MDQTEPVYPGVESTGEQTPKRFKWRTTIEFPLLLIMFGVTMSDGPITNIIMYRTCVHSLGYPVEKCRAFLKPGRTNDTRDIEATVQEYATFVSTVRSVLESFLPAVLSLFMIMWSDKHGRRPLILWTMFGVTLTSMMITAYGMMDSLGPWWYIVCCVPYSLTGGFSIMATAAMCYVTDVTGEKGRSLRIMVLDSMFAVGMAGGTLSSPHLWRAVGGVNLLLIVAAMLTVAYAFTAICIDESIENVEPGSMLSVLDFSLVKELFRECFKRRPNGLRAQILLVTGANTLDSFAVYGLSNLSYLFVRKVLHWSLIDYTQYSSVSIAITFFGSFLGVAVIQKILPIGDLAFSIISFASAAVNNNIKAFAVTGWQMYLATSVSLFKNLSSPLTRSFLSKILPSEDIAKVFALMCAIEGLCPLIAPVVYNSLYAVTLSSFPGTVLVVTGAINTVCVVLLGLVALLRWNTTANYAILQAEETS